jgi:hypothetical protein
MWGFFTCETLQKSLHVSRLSHIKRHNLAKLFCYDECMSGGTYSSRPDETYPEGHSLEDLQEVGKRNGVRLEEKKLNPKMKGDIIEKKASIFSSLQHPKNHDSRSRNTSVEKKIGREAKTPESNTIQRKMSIGPGSILIHI